jgi:hypothetical protein
MNYRRLRVVGVTLAAVFAISAVAAAAAQAGVWEAEEYPARVTGEQTTQIVFTGVVGSWKCGGLKFQGELSKESSQLDLAPTYEKCSWAGIAATVNMEGCTYRFTAGNTIGESSNKVEMLMGIICPAGKEIKLTLANECTIKFPEQTGISSAVAENTLTAVPKMAVDMTLELQQLTYTVEHGSLCPNAPGDGTYTNGTLLGAALLKGENPNTGEAIGLTVT